MMMMHGHHYKRGMKVTCMHKFMGIIDYAKIHYSVPSLIL